MFFLFVIYIKRTVGIKADILGASTEAASGAEPSMVGGIDAGVVVDTDVVAGVRVELEVVTWAGTGKADRRATRIAA